MCYQEDLAVDTMLSLGKKVGSHESCIAAIVSHNSHFRRAGRHVDGGLFQAYLHFGCLDILVAGTEYLINLWD